MKKDEKTIIQSGAEYFDDLVEIGAANSGISLSLPVMKYLGEMLCFYVDARNLHEPEYDESGRKNPQTLAEMWLTAQTAEGLVKKELLRKLGDRTLYISGFFSESLNRSLVDLDYYQSMGSSAYRVLASNSAADRSLVYAEMSDRFLELTELLNRISQDSFSQTDQGILRIYETYLRTGSNLAREKLENLGVFIPAESSFKKATGH